MKPEHGPPRHRALHGRVYPRLSGTLIAGLELDNHLGELARVCEGMARRRVNLLLCAITQGSIDVVAFTAWHVATSDPATSDDHAQ